MSAELPANQADNDAVAALRSPGTEHHRLPHALLARAVRGSRAHGGAWGEAILAELDETETSWRAWRWSLSALPLAWRERRHGTPRRSRDLPAPRRRLRHLVISLLAFAGLLLAVNTWVATISYQPSMSMHPTIDPGNRVLVDRTAYHRSHLGLGSPLGLGDVVELRNATFRRVAGLPGDRMGCRSGDLTRNGSLIRTPGTGRLTSCTPANVLGSVPAGLGAVPAGKVYLLGDDAAVAEDSRITGALPRTSITGRVVGRMWP